VSTGEVGVVERFGKFTNLAPPGLNFVCWPFSYVAARLSLRQTQLDVECETKTKDNVFCHVMVSVQYQVAQDKVYDACYKLTKPHDQIKAYVFDVIRSTVPRMSLDETFESKEEISSAVKSQLAAAMKEYGFEIIRALVTDINPDARVKAAMNEINSSKRLREAAAERAEADKILVVKNAEAHAESQYLSGVGVAKQRKAIVDGLKESVTYFSGSVGTGPKEILNLLMVTQYFDMLDSVGTKSKQSTLFMPHSPDAVMHLQAQLQAGLKAVAKK
jgi:regulator of protease activity HflC (stomatin/prohibitin superfamily)